MDDLPYLVIQRILEFTDIGSRRICRAVCSRLKAEIDSNTGLALTIDDRQMGLLDFIKGVIIKELNIKFLHCQDTEWLRIRFDDVQTLIFTGYVLPLFLTKNMTDVGVRNWQYLKKLYFYDSSMISQPFCAPRQPIKPILCSLPNLKDFHIVLTDGIWTLILDQFMFGLRRKYFTLNPEPDTQQNLYRILEDRVYQNALFLLRSITGPKLKNFFFSLGNSINFSPFELLKFLVKHSSLETVILPTLWIFDDEDNVLTPYQRMRRDDYLRQTKLKSVLFYLSRSGIEDQYWKDLIQAQYQLQDLFLQFDTLPVDTYAQFVSSIFWKNLYTLKFVTIQHYPNHEETGLVVLDMQVLQNSPYLEVLRIMVQGVERKRVFYPVPENMRGACGKTCCERATADPDIIMQLKNIHSLPKSLKVFQTTFSTPEDFDGVRFIQEMVNLEELKMTSIRRVGTMEPATQFTNFLRMALRHRKLHVFEIEVGFTIDVVPDVEAGNSNWDEIRLVVRSCDAAWDLLQSLFEPELDQENGTGALESLYLGGMYPESMHEQQCELGLVIGEDEHLNYHRHYFDCIERGFTNSIGTSQPYNIDHSTAKSYLVKGNPDDEKCWGTVRNSLRSITTSATEYSKIYNRCAAGQGFSHITVLQHKINFQREQAMLNLKKHFDEFLAKKYASIVNEEDDMFLSTTASKPALSVSEVLNGLLNELEDQLKAVVLKAKAESLAEGNEEEDGELSDLAIDKDMVEVDTSNDATEDEELNPDNDNGAADTGHEENVNDHGVKDLNRDAHVIANSMGLGQPVPNANPDDDNDAEASDSEWSEIQGSEEEALDKTESETAMVIDELDPPPPEPIVFNPDKAFHVTVSQKPEIL